MTHLIRYAMQDDSFLAEILSRDHLIETTILSLCWIDTVSGKKNKAAVVVFTA